MPYLVERRQLVTPGDLLAEGDYNAGENTYQEESKVYASRIGFANFAGKTVYVVALKGGYFPAVGDLVIGKVVDMRLGAWTIDINAPYSAVLFTSEAFDRSFNSRHDEMSRLLDIGDLIIAKIISVDRTRDPVLTVREPGLGKITKGHVIKITPTKVPRLIGRKGSMIGMLKRETGCYITIGQNGLVHISGAKPEMEALAIQAIYTVEKDAHTTGLTDHVSELIKHEKEGLVSSVS